MGKWTNDGSSDVCKRTSQFVRDFARKYLSDKEGEPSPLRVVYMFFAYKQVYAGDCQNNNKQQDRCC